MNLLLSVLMLGTLVVAVVCDLRARRIPNLLTLPIAGLGLAVNLFSGGASGLGLAAAGWVLAVGLLALPFMLNWLGAGDVKLVAALGALQGPQFVLATLEFTVLAGGVLAIIALGGRGLLVPALSSMLRLRPPVTAVAALRTPYAPAIALGALAAVLVRA